MTLARHIKAEVLVRAAVAASVIVASGPLSAQEHCVHCSGPDAIYRCVLENVAPSQSASQKLACITVLAREGRHDSCAIKTSATDCTGMVKRVDASSVEQQSASPVATKPAEPALPPRPATSSSGGEPPNTMEEAMRRATKSTGDGVSNAGKSINEGAKKTWDCLTSFFKAC